MKSVPPLYFLLVLLAVTLIALLIHKLSRHQRRTALRRLAGRWQMRYVPGDQFNLAQRLAAAFPIRHAGDIRILDVIYGSDDHRLRYFFTTEYTEFEDRGHLRQMRVMSVDEPSEHGPASGLSAPAVASEDLPLLEQYESLRSRLASHRPADAGSPPAPA